MFCKNKYIFSFVKALLKNCPIFSGDEFEVLLISFWGNRKNSPDFFVFLPLLLHREKMKILNINNT